MRHDHQSNSPKRAVRNNAVGFRGRATSSGPRRPLGMGGGSVRRFAGQRRITHPTTAHTGTITHVAVICSCVMLFLLTFRRRRRSLPKTPSTSLCLELRHVSRSESIVRSCRSLVERGGAAGSPRIDGVFANGSRRGADLDGIVNPLPRLGERVRECWSFGLGIEPNPYGSVRTPSVSSRNREYGGVGENRVSPCAGGRNGKTPPAIADGVLR